MPMEKPTFFAKVLRTLRQLTTTKGFSVKQIAEQLQHLNAKRNLKEVKSIVEKSLRYGVKKKILLEKCGKFHLSASKLQQCCHEHASQKKKKKRVRFKKGKTNINEALKNIKNRSVRRKSRKRNSRKSIKSKSYRGRKSNKIKNIATPSDESGETTDTKNQEENPKAKKSHTELIVEKKESKEPLNVTPERDVHSNCVNKNRIRDKQPNITEPPRLESETEIGWQPPRPPTRISRKNQSRHSSKVRKSLDRKYKHHCPHAMERRKHLKDFIPDDKSYRKYRTRSRHNCNHENSEESSQSDSNSKEKTCRKCHHHNCSGRCYHQSHYNPNDYLLERKISNTILDHLNKSLTVLDAVGENLTPFEVFLEANHNKLETIAENISAEEDDPAEEIESGAKEKFDASYIN